MAEHVRTRIRDAVVAVLRGTAPNKMRVYPMRRMPLQADQLPALLVYTLAEDAAVETMSGPRFLARDLDLVVEGVAQDNDELEAALDRLAVIIETRLGTAFSDPSSGLRSLARAGNLVRTEIGMRPPQSPDEAGTGHIVTTFRVNYRTRSENPELNT
jgi:hypothetical protein